MPGFWTYGLNLAPPTPPVSAEIESALTVEAALVVPASADLRVDPLVAEDDRVAQGAPLMRLRRQPEIVICAPIAGRVGHLDLGPGRRLSRIVLFREEGGDRHHHARGQGATSAAGIRAALMDSGLWRQFRSRPFGSVPDPREAPAAIFVMALDTRPAAPDPRQAIADALPAFERGLEALKLLAPSGVFLCQQDGTGDLPGARGVTVVKSRPVHPWGLAGFQIHQHCPATTARRVWDIAAEDVAAIGQLLSTGHLRETRLVSVTGPGLREPRLVRCQPWADLRGLSRGHLNPGPHTLLSGSALEGRESRWLHERDRQMTVLDPASRQDRGHWFLSALSRAARPLPLIPSAAVDQALAGAFPAMPLLRALSAGDAETAIRLGALSLLDEDLALADYVTCAEPPLSGLLHAMLRDIAREEAT